MPEDSTLSRRSHGDPLLGRFVELPSGEHAMVLSIEHEYDDGTTLRIINGEGAGTLTMRDTQAVRTWKIVG